MPFETSASRRWSNSTAGSVVNLNIALEQELAGIGLDSTEGNFPTLQEEHADLTEKTPAGSETDETSMPDEQLPFHLDTTGSSSFVLGNSLEDKTEIKSRNGHYFIVPSPNTPSTATPAFPPATTPLTPAEVLDLQQRFQAALISAANARTMLEITRIMLDEERKMCTVANDRLEQLQQIVLAHIAVEKARPISQPPEPVRYKPRSRHGLPADWIGGVWLAQAPRLPALECAEGAFRAGKLQQTAIFLMPLMEAGKAAEADAEQQIVGIYARLLNLVVQRSVGQVELAREGFDVLFTDVLVLTSAAKEGNAGLVGKVHDALSDMEDVLAWQCGLCYFYLDKPAQALDCWARVGDGKWEWKAVVGTHFALAMAAMAKVP